MMLNGCTKHDATSNEAPENKLEQAFFDLGNRADPLLQVVASKLQGHNRQHPFLDRIANAAGMPQWPQAMRITGQRTDLMSAQAKDARSTKAYFVPFVKKDARRISALLMVRVKGADTTYKMIYRQHYRGYGFAERPGRWNARKVMLLFAMMEEQLFGHKNFMVNDGRIMGGKLGHRYRLSFEPDTTSSDPNNQKNGLVTTCKKYKSCFTVGGPYVCATRTICKTEFVYDEPEEAQNFFDDDLGNGGGGEDGGFILVEPCPDQNNTEQTGWQLPNDSFYGIDPCDETAGWEEEKPLANQSIIDSLQGYPCAQEILKQLPGLNVEVEKILKNVFGVDSFVNVVFKVDQNLTKESEDGYTKVVHAGKSIFDVDVNLNPWVLNNSSKEYILVTMFHEAIHANIDYWNSRYRTAIIDSNQFKSMFPCFWDPQRPRSSSELQHHTEIANNYMYMMQNSIKTFNPLVSDKVALDLAFGGLQKTTVWMSRADTNSIKQSNQDARDFNLGQFPVLKLSKCE